MHKHIRSNDIKYNHYKNQFLQTFKIPLKKFHHRLLGFEIIEFDAWLKVPDGTSTADHIKKNFGEDALRMVEHLL